MLVVYVQVKHDRQVCDCEAETYGTGIMGMMVCLMFEFFVQIFCSNILFEYFV